MSPAMTIRKFSARARRTLALIALAAATPVAHAQTGAATYPDKSVRLVVPFAAGGALDVVGRIVGQKMTDTWGKQIVVDNRLGAGGNIGAEFVAKAPPDGYTLLMSSVTTQAINMSLLTKPPYDFVRDYAAVALVASAPLALVIHSSLPAKSVKEFIALARAHPGERNYFSSGYTRLPNLPTIAESGVKGYEAEQWYGVVAPAGTPPAIVNKLAAEIKVIVANPEVRERFYSQGIEPVYAGPEEFTGYIKSSVAKYAKVIKTLGLKVD